MDAGKTTPVRPLLPTASVNSQTPDENSRLSQAIDSESGTAKKTPPLRPVFHSYETAHSTITSRRSAPPMSGLDEMEDIDLNEVSKKDFSSTRPPKIDLGQDTPTQRKSIRKMTVGVLNRAFSRRKNSEVKDEEFIIGSERPDLDELRRIQMRPQSNQFDLEERYQNVIHQAPIASSHATLQEMMSQFRHDSLSDEGETDDEYAEDADPFYYQAYGDRRTQQPGQAPDVSLPTLPHDNRAVQTGRLPASSEITSESYGETRNLLAMGQQSSPPRYSETSRVSRLSVDNMTNLQSPLNRFSLLGRQVFGHGNSDGDISMGDVRLQPILNDREVSGRLHQQVSNSGPSQSSAPTHPRDSIMSSCQFGPNGPSSPAFRDDGGFQSSSDSNNILSFLSEQNEEPPSETVLQHAQTFYDQQQIDSSWVASQDHNEVRVPILQGTRQNSLSQEATIGDHSYQEEVHQETNENEWETVADTVSMGHYNSRNYSNNPYRQAGSSLANTSDVGGVSQDIEHSSNQAVGFPSYEAVVQHPGAHGYQYSYASRDIPGAEDINFLIPQYTRYRVGTQNSSNSKNLVWRPPPNAFTDPSELQEVSHSNPFISTPPEQLIVNAGASRGAIMNFGRDPYTNSSTSHSQGLTSTNYVSESQVMTGYDPGSSSNMWDRVEEEVSDEEALDVVSSRLSLPPPIPPRNPHRGAHYTGGSNSSLNSGRYLVTPSVPPRNPHQLIHNTGGGSNSTLNSYQYIQNAANEDDTELIPMVALSTPRPAHLRHDAQVRGTREPSRRPPGAFYQRTRASQRQATHSTERLIRSGTEATLSIKPHKPRPGSNIHPMTLRPWPRISTLPGSDGHHPSTTSRQISTPNISPRQISVSNNQSENGQSDNAPPNNMSNFQFIDPMWSDQYTAVQMAVIRTNHRRREAQEHGPTISNLQPPLLRPGRMQLIEDPALFRHQNNLSWLFLVLCVIIPGPFWFFYWYGAFDPLIRQITHGQVEQFGVKQKKIAFGLGCATASVLTIGIVALVWYLATHYN